MIHSDEPSQHAAAARLKTACQVGITICIHDLGLLAVGRWELKFARCSLQGKAQR